MAGNGEPRSRRAAISLAYPEGPALSAWEGPASDRVPRAAACAIIQKQAPLKPRTRPVANRCSGASAGGKAASGKASLHWTGQARCPPAPELHDGAATSVGQTSHRRPSAIDRSSTVPAVLAPAGRHDVAAWLLPCNHAMMDSRFEMGGKGAASIPTPAYSVPFNVRCPRCGAARGRNCVTKAGTEREPHDRRVAKAGGQRS